MRIYGILLELKRQGFKSQYISQTLLAVDQTVDRTSGRSTGPVDRCVRDVHKDQP